MKSVKSLHSTTAAEMFALYRTSVNTILDRLPSSHLHNTIRHLLCEQEEKLLVVLDESHQVLWRAASCHPLMFKPMKSERFDELVRVRDNVNARDSVIAYLKALRFSYIERGEGFTINDERAVLNSLSIIAERVA